MQFNSSDFLIFFPIAAIVYFVIPFKVRYLWLLACSYYFYMCWNPEYALLMLFSTAITWVSGVAMERVKQSAQPEERKIRYKKWCVAASFLLNLSVLAYFKYTNFFITSINRVLEIFHATYQVPAVDILLPVGISFYTLQALSYTMDVYRDEIYAEKNFLRYALFVSFFPQLVAGPIERSKNLLRQLNEKHTFSLDKLRSGLMLMLWGYFMKMVIADRAAVIVDAVYEDYAAYPGWYLIVASVLFAIQIYCDFAGYSTIAMGAAEVMGIHLTDNFNAPYLAQSVSGYWHRWHISLSSWFKDYLYIPLGGNRKGRWRKYLNIMIVFLLSGLWHGARWSYVAWGGLNGLYQVIGDLLKPIKQKTAEVLKIRVNTFSHKLLRVMITFCIVDISLVFFRSKWIQSAFAILKSIFTAKNIWILFDESLFNLGLDEKNFKIMMVAIVVLLAADICKYRGIVIREALCRQELWLRWLVLIAGVLSVLLFGVWGSGYDAASFIYFQF